MKSIVLAMCIVWAGATFAQETRYRLERIIVEGSNVAEEIIRGEARLDEERTYTEEDFRQAVYRIRRLPFVTDATYRIEPGVSSGGTALIVKILDTAPIFYGADLQATRRSDGETVKDGSLLLGGRWLLDNLGVLEGAVQKSDNDDGFLAGVAYRAYDIYGTGATGSIAIAQRFKATERVYDPQAVLTLGWPLTQRQTVTFTASRSKSRVTRNFDVNGDDDTDPETITDIDDNLDLTNRDRFTFAELRWAYESIDDPLVPTLGVSASAGPRYFNTENIVQTYDGTTKKIVGTELKANAYGLVLDLAAYRTLFGRTVGFARLNGDASQTDKTEIDTRTGIAQAGLAFDLHRNVAGALRPFKSRFEVGAGYRTYSVEGPGNAEFKDDGAFAQSSFVLRHRWGTIRLTGTYTFE
ncbi:MAG: hypothetical protein ABI779_06230 [Acidobacteriota bacterium]